MNADLYIQIPLLTAQMVMVEQCTQKLELDHVQIEIPLRPPLKT